jgi:hypothetical protein
MADFKKLLFVSTLIPYLAAAGPDLDQAEVKLSYGELKTLVNEAARPITSREPDSALLSSRFRLGITEGKLEIVATFRTTTFADGLAKVPLVGGEVSVQSQNPATARVLIHEKMLCHVLEKAGAQVVEVKLLPTTMTAETHLTLPACPATIFETGEITGDHSFALTIEGKEQVIGSNQAVAMPLTGGVVEVRLLGGEETREALRPPEPSEWTWQHQALVTPEDGEIHYRVLAHASAASGSGVAAVLVLPKDAREVRAAGADLAGQRMVRGSDYSLELQLDWKTRGLLEREIEIYYQLPRRPLDKIWKLQAPFVAGKDLTQTRFIIADLPEYSYTAKGLLGPFPPKGLPSCMMEDLKGASSYQLETTAMVDLTVQPLPLVATAEATINEASWTAKLEPDGAMLLQGTMNLEHRGRFPVVLDIPTGLTLLTCEVAGQAIAPVNCGENKLEINLPVAAQKTTISCSFTGRINVLDPVAGTLDLSLPQTPLFIKALTWSIELPARYQAETNGNLVRVIDPRVPASQLILQKNLCRDERPLIHIFYQRSNLKLNP